MWPPFSGSHEGQRRAKKRHVNAGQAKPEGMVLRNKGRREGEPQRRQSVLTSTAESREAVPWWGGQGWAQRDSPDSWSSPAVGSKFSSTDRRFHRLCELCRERTGGSARPKGLGALCRPVESEAQCSGVVHGSDPALQSPQHLLKDGQCRQLTGSGYGCPKSILNHMILSMRPE